MIVSSKYWFSCCDILNAKKKIVNVQIAQYFDSFKVASNFKFEFKPPIKANLMCLWEIQTFNIQKCLFSMLEQYIQRFLDILQPTWIIQSGSNLVEHIFYLTVFQADAKSTPSNSSDLHILGFTNVGPRNKRGVFQHLPFSSFLNIDSVSIFLYFQT